MRGLGAIWGCGLGGRLEASRAVDERISDVRRIWGVGKMQIRKVGSAQGM